MDKTLAELSIREFEELIERTIDKRLEVWLTQLAHALSESRDKDEAQLRPDFAVALRRALEQARAGEGVDLKTFREQLTR